MANNLTFDNFSFKNKQRCEQDYDQPLRKWDVDMLMNRVGLEWNELVAEIDSAISVSDHPLIIDEACDVIIMLDLLIQRLGGNTSAAIADKFNRTSDKIGSQIKIPV